jgi:uncharacterized protein (DUF1499 family)
MSGSSRLGTRLPHWLLAPTFVFLSACAGNQATTALVNDRFAPCPESRNCVSSDATDEEHRIEPYRLTAPAQKAWHGLQNVVAAELRMRLIEVDDVYLHVEVESAVMRFVDDTEFHLRADEGIIAVRSAARNRKSDGGANRERVEHIRKALQTRGLVE